CLRQRRLVAASEHHMGALFDEEPGRGEADAAVAAGDEGGLAGKLVVHGLVHFTAPRAFNRWIMGGTSSASIRTSSMVGPLRLSISSKSLASRLSGESLTWPGLAIARSIRRESPSGTWK